MIKDKAVIKARGTFYDEIFIDGRFAYKTEKKENQLQVPALALIMARLSNYAWDEFTYLAVGQGNAAWDMAPPIQDPAQSILTSELGRKPITSMKFIDAVGVVSATPTNILEIELRFEDGEATGVWREAGIFGGDATGVIDSGQMYNWMVYDRFEKLPNMTVVRRIQLELTIG